MHLRKCTESLCVMGPTEAVLIPRSFKVLTAKMNKHFDKF